MYACTIHMYIYNNNIFTIIMYKYRYMCVYIIIFLLLYIDIIIIYRFMYNDSKKMILVKSFKSRNIQVWYEKNTSKYENSLTKL